MNGFDSFTQFALPPNSLSNLDSPIAKEADVFVMDFDGTWTLFGSAESLGLKHFLPPFNDPFADDNLDALDSLVFLVIPEPATLSLLAVSMLMACRRRRRCR